MCGIVGYIGKNAAFPVLMDGLQRLSYRGYDSAGIAVADQAGCIQIRKAQGKLSALEKKVFQKPPVGMCGIGHTRWATHGEPSDRNAHPHTDTSGKIAVVHNGIIENHHLIRSQLERKGICFSSQTDTEVIAHLLSELYAGDMLQALTELMKVIKGSYALVVICEQEPGKLFCIRKDSPLIIGFRETENYVASDIPALMKYTRDVVMMEDDEIAILSSDDVRIYDHLGNELDYSSSRVDWDEVNAEKEGYPHFMLKEIFEQPFAIKQTMASRIHLGVHEWLPLSDEEVLALNKITFVACGSAYHAAMYGKYAIEKMARISVEVAIASEYRYRFPVFNKSECVIAISQSGETADTLAALRMARQAGVRTIGICNTHGSSISREIGEENIIYTHAGLEVAVASTKAYITQVVALLLLAVALGDIRKTTPQDKLQTIIRALQLLPSQMEEMLKSNMEIEHLASRMQQVQQVFLIGRGMDYPLVMESALKLKEISYLFSEAYAAGELKHGPLALITKGQLVIAAITQTGLLEKTISNLREVLSRGADLFAVCSVQFAKRLRELEIRAITVPDTDDLVAPLMAVIPFQLLAYHAAIQRGCDVDQPRNLAKSVTVE